MGNKKSNETSKSNWLKDLFRPLVSIIDRLEFIPEHSRFPTVVIVIAALVLFVLLGIPFLVGKEPGSFLTVAALLIFAVLIGFAVWHMLPSSNKSQKSVPTNPLPAESPAVEATAITFDLNTHLSEKFKSWNTLRLFGQRDIKKRGVASPSLDQLYIHMDTTDHHKPETDASELDERGQHQGPPISVIEALADNTDGIRSIVLHGKPGSGKSSVVRYLCLSLADWRLQDTDFKADEKLPNWPHGPLLPVLIPLWQLAQEQAQALKNGDAVEQFLRSPSYYDGETRFNETAARNAGDTLLKQLRESGGFVVFDGLDEVPAAQHPMLCRALERFYQNYPRCRVVFTVRTHSWNQSQLNANLTVLRPQPKVYGLAGFDENRPEHTDREESQIEQFILRWFQCQQSIGQKLDAKADSLRQALRGHSLQQIASTPLLLTIICLIHQTEKDGLPDTRVELYEKASMWLLLHWQAARQGSQRPVLVDRLSKDDVRDTNYNAVNPEHIMKFLQTVSFQAQASGKTSQSQQELASINESLLQANRTMLGEGRDESGKDVFGIDIFIEYCESENGLLQKHGIDAQNNREYVFPHRSFQEYLAAGFFDQNKGHRAAAEKTGEMEWRETLLFYAEMQRGQPDLLGLLLETLCPYEPPAHSAEAELRLALAAELIDHSPLQETLQTWLKQPAQESFKTRFIERLVNLLNDPDALTDYPARRAPIGDALARLGDPRPGTIQLRSTRVGKLPEMAFAYVPGTDECNLKKGFCLGYTPKELRSWDKSDLGWQPSKSEHWPNEKGIEIEGFWMAAYPVTVAQFEPFIEGDGYHNDGYWPNEAKEWRGDRTQNDYWEEQQTYSNRPMLYVTWYEAVAYCRWLSEQLERLPGKNKIRDIRLPTEREWEWAARGPERRHFPWGNQPFTNAANTSDVGIGRECAVGSFPLGSSWVKGAVDKKLPDPLIAAPALHDLTGNVWEWCSTKWEKAYKPDKFSDKEWDARTWGKEDRRVLRGNAYYNNGLAARGALRSTTPPRLLLAYRGYRCCAPVFLDSDS